MTKAVLTMCISGVSIAIALVAYSLASYGFSNGSWFASSVTTAVGVGQLFLALWAIRSLSPTKD